MGTRFDEHPILGTTERGRLVSFTYDGKTLQGYEGEPVAVALSAAGVKVHRYTAKRHEPRAVPAGMSAAIEVAKRGAFPQPVRSDRRTRGVLVVPSASHLDRLPIRPYTQLAMQ